MLLTQVAGALLPSAGNPAALGADLLEVGYQLRAGVDLNHYLALWDVMSRNAVLLTGTGVSDDHVGDDWYGIGNNWITSVWAASTGMADLIAALAAGRAWCGSLSAYRGALDLLVDGLVPMGAVSVSSVTSRQLVAAATGLPAGSTLQILQGAVDYAGQAGLRTDEFRACMTSADAAAAVDANIANGKLLEVNSTPTLFVNGRRVVGADGHQLEQVIQYELQHLKKN